VSKAPLPVEDARPATQGSSQGAATGTATGSRATKGTYLRPFRRRLPEPDPDGCELGLAVGKDAKKEFQLGHDFVPVAGCDGNASGELVFVGFGIDAKTEHYDDLDGLNVRGKIALIVEGEPRNSKAFEGTVISPAASLWTKLEKLARLGAAGVIAVRRSPEMPEKGTGRIGGAKTGPARIPGDKPSDKQASDKPAEKSPSDKTGHPPASDAPKDPDPKPDPKSDKEKPKPDDEPELGFRYSWATFNGAAPDARSKTALPTLEVTSACASALLGEDVAALATKIDKSAHPLHPKHAGRNVTLRSKTRDADVQVDNVAGLIPGTDEKLAGEFVVVGAHYDHIGVDARGRIGYGADDNASGSAGLLEIAEALALAPPRRSVIVCSFAGEEEGLLGSKAFCAHLPVTRERIVAMVNLDMIGRGSAAEVAVLGIVQNPSLEKVLERAKALHPTGVQQIVMRQGEELFQRSDHYSFHEIGVPALFFFEGLPIEKNPDYHTWRDTADLLDLDKMLRTTRLTFNAVWLLANDDTRPPKPQN
jgi:hypothetical protein